MMNFKTLSLGLVAATMLATPVMAQGIYQPGVIGYGYPNAAYTTSGYGVRVAPGPGYYYYGNRIRPAPRVGAFATAPWDDGYYPSYGSYGAYGLVERQW